MTHECEYCHRHVDHYESDTRACTDCYFEQLEYEIWERRDRECEATYGPLPIERAPAPLEGGDPELDIPF